MTLMLLWQNLYSEPDFLHLEPALGPMGRGGEEHTWELAGRSRKQLLLPEERSSMGAQS